LVAVRRATEEGKSVLAALWPVWLAGGRRQSLVGEKEKEKEEVRVGIRNKLGPECSSLGSR